MDRLGVQGDVRAPRDWSSMIRAWTYYVLGLASCVHLLPPRRLDFDPAEEKMVPVDLDQGAWAWMWTLPLYSEARKMAFTLGWAARLIERWRKYQGGPSNFQDAIDSIPIGLQAEAALRILSWHLLDAKGERDAREKHRIGITIPQHERLYQRALSGKLYIGDKSKWKNENGSTLEASDRLAIARIVLKDHLGGIHPTSVRRAISDQPELLSMCLAEIALASLPTEGTWTMTSIDVSRFLSMFVEEA